MEPLIYGPEGNQTYLHTLDLSTTDDINLIQEYLSAPLNTLANGFERRDPDIAATMVDLDVSADNGWVVETSFGRHEMWWFGVSTTISIMFMPAPKLVTVYFSKHLAQEETDEPPLA